MHTILGHICAMSALVGLICLIHPKLRLQVAGVLFWGIFFGLMSGTAQLLLLGGK